MEAPLHEGEARKPGVSPKPVPAPRHFFLRKPSVTKPPGDVPAEPVSELSNVWARRSRSVATLPSKEKEEEKEKVAVDKEEEKENEPSKEVIINVKERAKSFSGIQNLAFVSPQPFRPTSIAHEIQMTKVSLLTAKRYYSNFAFFCRLLKTKILYTKIKLCT